MMNSAFNAQRLAKLLVKFNANALEKYLHELIDSWLSRGKLKFDAHSAFIELEDWWDVQEEFEKLALSFVNAQTDEEFQKSLESSFKTTILTVLVTRKADLVRYFQTRSNDFTQTYLKNFDWSLKLTCSSDKYAKLNEPHCLIGLYSDLNGGKGDAHFEMKKTELDAFISTLESIQAKMEKYEP